MKKLLHRILIKIGLIKDPKIKYRRHALVGSAKRWKIKQNFQIKFLEEQGLEKNHIFLDIGCGTLRGGVPIIKFLNPRKYYGIDIRIDAIKEAVKELKDERLQSKNVTIELFNTYDDLSFGVEFDRVLAFSVLIHMKDDILGECLNYVSKNLSEDGLFYANVNVGELNESNWLEFPVMFKSLEFYENMALKYGLKVESLGTLHSLGHITNDALSDKQLMLKFTKS